MKYSAANYHFNWILGKVVLTHEIFHSALRFLFFFLDKFRVHVKKREWLNKIMFASGRAGVGGGRQFLQTQGP